MAYSKYKTTIGNPVKPAPGAGTGSGRVYAGGTPDFNERTGLYRPGSPNERLNPPTKKPGIGVKPGGPVAKPGRPKPKPKPGKKAIPQPYQIGPNDMPSLKIPGRKTIMPVPRKTISSMGRKQPTARKGGGR